MTVAPRATDRVPLLGRDDLVGLAEEMLASCRAGRGGLLWVQGDAGIGKTRLLQEIGDRAGDAAVLHGSGWEDPGTPAFWVWTQVLRSAAGLVAPESWTARGTRARILLDGTGEDPDSTGGRFALFDAVAGVLDQVAAERPAVLVLDDLHWADAGSLRLLHFLTSDLAQRRVVVACGWRDHESGLSQERRELAAQVAARGQSVLLDGLGETDVQRLIEITTGRPAGAEETRVVTSRTGGNPLFVSEMARLARSRGRDSVATLVPETAQATIRRRVARLPQDAESALAAAAVLGASLSIPALAEVMGRAAVELLPTVDVLVEAGLLTLPSGRLEFSHALVRDAVHDSLSAVRRRELHLAAATVVAAASEADGFPDRHAAELAHHLGQALPLVPVDDVVAAATRAARAATAVQAYEEALGWSDQALDLAGSSSPRRPELLLLCGEAHLMAGDPDGARQHYLEAADRARATGDAEHFARACLGFAVGLSGFEVRLWDRRQNDLLEEALVVLGEGDSPLRAQVLARLSVGLSFSAPTDRRIALAGEAVAMARRLDDPRALGGALAAHCDALAGPAYVDLREAEAGEIIELAREVADLGLELLGLRLRVVARLEHGSLSAAELDMAEFERVSERLRQPFFGWYVPLWRGLRAHLAGDLEQMKLCAEEVRRLGELGGSRNASMLSLVQASWDLIERGRTRENMQAMQAAFGELPELAGDGTSLIRFFPGHDVGVREAALPLFPEILADLSVDKEWLPNLAAVALGFWESGIGGAPARLLHDTLLPWRDLCLVDGIGAAMAGSTERTLGLLATLLEEYDAAADHFERALRVNATIGAPLAVANTQREYAQLLARRAAEGDAELRQSLLAEALTFYRRVGIGERVAEVEAVLAASPAAPAPEPASGGVLRREGAVWSLTWRGRSAVLPAVKGLADLAVLLAQPDREVHVLDLVGVPAAARGDLGAVLDDKARAAYRRRLETLEEEQSEAEAAGDDAAFDRAASEREFLLAELGAAYGLGGRARRAGDPAERARTTVTSRIRDAIGRVDAVHPELGRHLRASVRTGIYCCYAPEVPTTWETPPTS